ncbi:type 2 isopentenyl-diphosphate Delta-isomerase [Salisediminibacterium halotolerans]|uniref:type 2 isopentenyl-diphosphate Delta-isomerase n=1 Tax=Salisediminibacterium halotolerans TaxID=517425 RepID=UPI000EAFD08F|nr:type 2 isopentenyl-diphosphate Delta-isomerase [Salisediminibacterium halotolerans]RLJ77958.1 isopentenyl-diphosphate delta-isomerase [Actinophytocola xinjiangensis]RPE88704.1 isopentenyl-diphosphate delta-isomerase [Salisediminibacterium halotolerans]TWG36935.1 isopentenyl-diphosphate delta-isomerase [Salisediminibacterium halotolerans]GEL08104.1 isopentenyl-diphosphate delta-isomerase [Salisediminibacterium halotolerans]
MSRSERKMDHVKNALSTGQSRQSGLDDVTFVHNTLPGTAVENISLLSEIGGLHLSSPIFINAMTGGGGRNTETINRQLAQLANVFHIPIAVGSQMSAIKDSSEAHTYKVVRQYHPCGLIFANVGSEASVDEARYCVDLLEADALQIHLNVIQELVMPEGDRDFRGALERIEAIVSSVNVPVIVKEVGFGMSRETVSKLYSAGVEIVDIGGYGGTNFAKIENARRDDPMTFFNDWGIPTTVSVIEAASVPEKREILATGGIQTAFDAAKVIALGANAAGMAGRVLYWMQNDGFEQTISHLERVFDELKMIMAATGAGSIKELQQSPLIISGNTKAWLNERGIDTEKFARRG